MPTQSEMALAHSKTQNTNLTNETIDEKRDTSPGNSIADDHPQKSKRSFMTLNFWICFAISLGQIAFGYPASIIATTLGQPAFLLYMGLVKEDGSMEGDANALIGATSGVFQVRLFPPSTRCSAPRCFFAQRTTSELPSIRGAENTLRICLLRVSFTKPPCFHLP